MNYMLMPLRRYADFNGRSRRKEFWMWTLLNLIVSCILLGVLMAMSVSAFSRVDERGGVRYESSTSYERDYDSGDSRGSDERDSEAADSGSRYEEEEGGSSRSSRNRDRYDDYTTRSWDVDPAMLAQEIGPMFWLMFALWLLWTLFAFIPNLAVTIRRLHDTDKSGWMYLLVFIPLVGPIVILVFMCIEGTRGENRFGPDPKGQGVENTFA